MNVSKLILARLIDLLLQADELHGISPFAEVYSPKLLQLGQGCQFGPIDNSMQACFKLSSASSFARTERS
jgi:hypothetical protein